MLEKNSSHQLILNINFIEEHNATAKCFLKYNTDFMPLIKLETHINAPIAVCFDLSRSIDLHKDSFAHTKEEAVSGVVSGLIDAGEHVCWKANHFGFSLQLCSLITTYNC